MKNITKLFLISSIYIFVISNLFFARADVANPGLDAYQNTNASTSTAGMGTCNPDEVLYEKSQSLFDIDIRRTVDNFVTSMFVSAFSNVTGTNFDIALNCEQYLENALLKSLSAQSTVPPCSGTPDNECKTLTSSVAYRMGGDETLSVRERSIQNSLIGFSNTIEGVARNEPLPTNLAYFWNQSIAKVPFANKAFAATNAYDNLPIVKAAFGAWRFARNVSLALVSVILLYTGIMIIMRKKVNPQLVVSVQYAIPKIIIGLLLIIFSYPIGATIASISWGLFRGGFDLIFNTAIGSASGAVPENASGLLLLTLVIASIHLGMGGVAYMIMVIAVALIVVVLKIIVYFKAILVYLKMVFSIISAPLEFTLGTVPGSEDRIKDWFMRMAKYAITIFAMGVIIPITLIMALSVVIAYRTGSSAEMGGWGGLMSIIAPLIIVIFGFSIAIGMDKTIDTLLFEGGKKKH